MKEDNIIEKFTNSDDYEFRLNELEMATKYIHELPINKFSISVEDEDSLINLSEADIDTIERGTRLFLDLGNDTRLVPVRECCMASIQKQFAINGESLNAMTKETLAEVLTTAAKTRKGQAQAVIVEGKISAILSDSNNKIGYVPLPAPDAYREVTKAIGKIAPVIDFNGVITYSMVTASWKLNTARVVNGKSFKVMLNFSTSDIGSASLRLSADLCSDRRVPVCTPISISHRNTSSMDDVEEAVDMVRAVLDKNCSRLQFLSTIEIKFPETCFLRVCKKLRLPKKQCHVVAHSGVFEEKDKYTAFDVYLSLSVVFDEYCHQQAKPEWQELLRDNVLKGLGLSWSNYDMPGNFIW